MNPIQLLLRGIWGGLIYVPMPWQAAIGLILAMFFLPLSLLRVLPWLMARALQVIFLLANGAVLAVLWLFYKLEVSSRKFEGEFADNLRQIEQFLQRMLIFLERTTQACQKLEQRAFQRKWLINEKKLYLLPLIILPLWVLRPWLDSLPGIPLLLDKSVASWCSLEHWSMTGQWQPSALTCSYPNKPSPWNSGFKLIEYQNKQKILDITKRLNKNPENAKLLLERANAFLSIEKFDLAFKDFTKALDFNEANVFAYVGRGKVYLARKDSDGAYSEFNKALQENPKYAPAYTGRGDVYQKKGDKEAALVEYEKAANLDQQYAPTYYSRANLQCYRFGDQVKAIKDYNQAEELYRSQGDPVNAWKVRQSISQLDTFYKIRRGDTLNEIASRFNTSVENIATANYDRYASLSTNPDSIEPGWEIRIPVCK